MQIVFDEERARTVFGVLEPLWRYRQTNPFGRRLFGDIVLPQDRHQPSPEPLAHALILFFGALFMRGGIVSEDPFDPLWRLWRQFPEMFFPEKVVKKWPVERIKEAFRTVDALEYKIDQHARSWRHNAACLWARWQCDPRLIFAGRKDFEEAFAVIDYRRNSGQQGLVGMRRKIFALLAIWLQEKRLVSLFPCPIPVDFHALRVLWATEIMKIETISFVPGARDGQEALRGLPAIRVSEAMVDIVTRWTYEFLPREGFSHLHINPALWVLSRELCAGQLQNSNRGNGVLVYRIEELMERPAFWPRGYTDPCGYCPIEQWCTGAVPSRPHYRWGLLVRLLRAPFPRERFLLPGVDWKEFSGPVRQKTDKRRFTERRL